MTSAMIVTLAILIFCLGAGSGEERWKESSYLHPLWETKCRLTRVEQHIHEYKRNGSLLYLPRLRDLRPRYPGDTFKLVREDACVDINPKMCGYLAEKGHCTGADSEVMSSW